MKRRRFVRQLGGVGIGAVAAAAAGEALRGEVPSEKRKRTEPDPPVLTLEVRWEHAKSAKRWWAKRMVDNASEPYMRGFVDTIHSSRFVAVKEYLVAHGLPFEERVLDGVTVLAYKNAVWAPWPECSGVI